VDPSEGIFLKCRVCSPLRFRGEREQLKTVKDWFRKAKARIWPSQGQIMAVVVLYVPSALDSSRPHPLAS